MRDIAGKIGNVQDGAEDGCYEGEVGGVDVIGGLVEDNG